MAAKQPESGSVTRKRLGRGLDALLSGDAGARHEAEIPTSQAELPVDQVVRGRYQPRREFAQESLEELAASIKAQGLMQPIVVRPRPQGGFELIAGERRWRATQMAGLQTIPAVIKDVTDEQASAMALIENIQREDLNPLEEAFALQRLKEEFELTQQQVADAVGKSRTQVTNLLRLLALDPEVQTLLERGDLDMGHARALLVLTAAKQRRAAHEVVNQDLTVRATEALVKRLAEGEGGKAEPPPPVSPDVARLETRLGEVLGAPVKIQHGRGGKGRVTIRYSSLDELDGILEHIR